MALSPSASQQDLAKVIPVILCGGSGTRLWPLSRNALPKQFLPLDGEYSMLQETAQRLSGEAFAAPWFVCSEDSRFTVAGQAQDAGLPVAKILLEPVPRGTAPAAALAALAALREYPDPAQDPLLLLAPADHVVRDPARLRAVIEAAAPTARSGKLVVFGIQPGGPEAGYGYIQAGAAIADTAAGARAVTRFTEKPQRDQAAAFIASGDYFWNSGIFLFTARHFLSELQRLRPDIAAAASLAVQGWRSDLDFTRIDAEAFAACPADAIDTAVMEKTDKAAMFPLDAGWSDVGTWAALWEIGAHDAADNVLRGPVFAVDSERSYLRSDGPLLATLGVADLLVVATDDAVLVAPRERAQDLRQVVDRLKQAGRPEVEQNLTVYRPWGSYRRIDAGERYQVKLLRVNPGASLSLQLHHHRAEHWVVVSGTARITCGEATFLLSENQATFIPLGVKHRLENAGKLPLLLIEVQSGSYLGEDDIVRF